MTHWTNGEHAADLRRQLAAQRAQIIEECAKVAEAHADFRRKNDDFSLGSQVGEDIAAAIRALKPANTESSK